MQLNCISSTLIQRSTRRAHRWRPSSQTRSTPRPSPPEPLPLPESASPVQAEVVLQALSLELLDLQVDPPADPLDPPELQAEEPEQGSLVSTGAPLLLPPPPQPQLPP